jgi:hypothetical protein
MPRTRLVCGAAGAAAALLLVGLVAAQTRPPVVEVYDALTQARSATPPPSADAPVPTRAPREQQREKGIDELVATLERIKSQKSELDKAEKETAALLKEKLRQQRQRLEKLGIAEEPQHVPVPTTSYAVPIGEATAPAGLVPVVPPMPRSDVPGPVAN